jgi:hypothetical protein
MVAALAGPDINHVNPHGGGRLGADVVRSSHLRLLTVGPCRAAAAGRIPCPQKGGRHECPWVEPTVRVPLRTLGPIKAERCDPFRRRSASGALSVGVGHSEYSERALAHGYSI